MDTSDKFLSSDGLSYFIGLTDPLIISQANEITTPEFANENNIVILWGSGEKIKSVAPDNIGYDTKFLYIGAGVYIEEGPDDIYIYGGNTGQEVTFGSYSLYRTRDSSSVPWPNTFEELNGDDMWVESNMRSKRMIGWYKSDGSTVGVGIASVGATSDEAAGYLTPTGYYNTDLLPVYSN